MMIRTMLLCGALALVAPAAASAQSTGMGPGMGAGMGAGMSSGPAPSAADYMMKAGQSDVFEKTEGKLAAKMGHSAKVKAFGAQMVKDHTKSTAMVKAAAAKSGLPAGPPPPLSADQEAMIAQLRSAGPAKFDATYVTQQLQAHQDALALQSSYAASGDDPHLKAAAGKITPVVKMHIAMLQKMQAAM